MIKYASKKEKVMIKKYGIFNAFKNTKGVVRDHKYSRWSGYNENVNPILLRHPVNCEWIKHSENVSKRGKNTISLENLIDRIIRFKSKWKEHEMCLEIIKQGGLLKVRGTRL